MNPASGPFAATRSGVLSHPQSALPGLGDTAGQGAQAHSPPWPTPLASGTRSVRTWAGQMPCPAARCSSGPSDQMPGGAGHIAWHDAATESAQPCGHELIRSTTPARPENGHSRSSPTLRTELTGLGSREFCRPIFSVPLTTPQLNVSQSRFRPKYSCSQMFISLPVTIGVL